jgi:acyl transferase domain-containing protein/3-hydroxymyristoyl/3-hydroxydecanoyl-(acyl carrier protein) dehydratase
MSAARGSVAIVGIGGVFPGARDFEEFWANIVNARDAAREAPAGRWALDPAEAFDARPGQPDKVYSVRGCFVEREPRLDPRLKLPVEDPAGLDPSTRLLLAAGAQAYQDASMASVNAARIGVILGNLALPTESAAAIAEHTIGRTLEEKVIGAGTPSHARAVHPLNRFVTGMPAGILATALGLGGGTMTLDAACASSLFAVKLAADELLAGRADAMLAGGLSRPDALYTQMGFSQLRALSPTGTCSPFDERGNGLVVGEGAGVLVLKRTADAVRDGDRIYAVIRGIGVSNDVGGGLLAPSSDGQVRAMRAAYAQAGLSPQDIDLIECHATGTPLGDGVEFESLRTLWGSNGWTPGQCVIGSVKSNIGHLLTAAGSAALIKTLLAMKESTLPPTANFRRATPALRMEDSPFRVLNTGRPWTRRADGVPRRAGVSAFGFGGINAHVVLEEWLPEQTRSAAVVAPTREDAPAIAVVGLDARFGPWDSLRTFQEHALGGGESHEPREPRRWWGVRESAWFRDGEFAPRDHRGHYLGEVDAPLERFRIPPREIEEMLPQQLLMLQAAASALDDCVFEPVDTDRAGVFIGVGLDFNTTNYMLRWSLPAKARVWAKRLGLNLGEAEFDEWLKSLRDATGPALTANRTMGGLASIAASRIARQFRFGGPSFTVSSEETSGLRAIEVAIRALQQGDIDFGIAGAVDLCGDPRVALGMNRTPCDGAAAVALKRLADAERDGDRVYAVIRDVTAMNAGIGADSAARALKLVLRDGETPQLIESDAAQTAEVSAWAAAQDDCYIRASSIQTTIGHAGAASGLAAFTRACLAIYHEILPPGRDAAAPEFWLRNRADGPRRAVVLGHSSDGNTLRVALEAHDGAPSTRPGERAQPLGARPEGLFCVEANNIESLLIGLERLRAFAQQRDDGMIEHVARQWWQENREDASRTLGAAFVARTSGDLIEQIAFLDARLRDGRAEGDWASDAPPNLRDRVFFSREPLGTSGEVAFVFPGSGNQFAGMGRDLGVEWPEVLRQQDRENARLRDQFQPDVFWHAASPSAALANPKAALFGQVALGTATADLVQRFGVRPRAVVGYSLGETAGLFALKAWTDRDLMLDRINNSTLFTEDLAGEYRAARRAWKVPAGKTVDWALGVIDRPAKVVRAAMKDHKKVYSLIVNTLHECVVGGDPHAVQKLVRKLDCEFFPLQGVTTVHCEVAKEVQGPYRELHVLPTAEPRGIRFYSGAWGTAYRVSAETAADSVLAQAIYGIDYPRVIEAAYTDGVRIFLEMGPGGSCSRMIGEILKGRPHVARSACMPGRGSAGLMLRMLANLIAERVPVDLSVLYGQDTKVSAFGTLEPAGRTVSVPVGHGPMDVALTTRRTPRPIEPRVEVPALHEASPARAAKSPAEIHEQARELVSIQAPEYSAPLVGAWSIRESAHAAAHETFLRQSEYAGGLAVRIANLQRRIAERVADGGADLRGSSGSVSASPHEGSCGLDRICPLPDWPIVNRSASADMTAETSGPVSDADHSRGLFMDRAACLEFAIGSIARSLGPEWSAADAHPTRVRLPDEPLMLVDRVLSLEGEPRSLGGGRVITEHDILPGAWYLDGGRIPTCIAVEAGQADLLLSGYLGIDAVTRGNAMYRLLDAQVTFHRGLPGPGETIHYDIRIERFFRQGDTHLFRFNFDATVAGEPLLTMRNGCAGFFTREELDAGAGVVKTALDLRPMPGVRPKDWRELVPMARESYNDEQLACLRRGDLAGCFGEAFGGLPLRNPVSLPAGRMELVDRILELDPAGGRYGLGRIRGEMDVRPDDWFLTCHFVDDMVMPGTLMYECCLHTLRVHLMRMGWIGEADEFVYEPVPGVAGQLKCRGEVNAASRKVEYEVAIKELGFNPHPYVIADSLMYVDGKPAVEMTNMSLQLTGLTRERLDAIWAGRVAGATMSAKPRYDYKSILAFSSGNPSEAFGDRYKPFDHDRVIARLPRPPFQFLDRVTEVRGEPWAMKAGAEAVAEYDVPPDEWYFAANRDGTMPFAVLLETALQPCGWLAAYMGSALTSEVDLRFRNLGGSAVQYETLRPDAGTLRTHVKCTGVSQSGGMIIQHYSFDVQRRGRRVYRGDTHFGYFSEKALANQVGLRDAKLYQPTAAERAEHAPFAYPRVAPYPSDRMRMVDTIQTFTPRGGPHGLGHVCTTIDVDPGAWFFRAHFYQDPVWPGSLGLEGFLQLMRFLANERWNPGPEARVQSVALGEEHRWLYRGQVIPADGRVTIEANVTAVDDDARLLRAEGHLVVDGRVIYRMENFAVRAVEDGR